MIFTIDNFSYLETGVSSYNMQPWVWMVLLGCGPFISGCLGTQYLYTGVCHAPVGYFMLLPLPPNPYRLES